MIRDFFKTIMECIASMSSGDFFGAFILSLALGGLCWIACSYYTRLWNKRFRVKFQHHLLCVVAALFTVTFTIQFSAVRNLELIVDGIIANWYKDLMDDYGFHAETYANAFYTLKEMNPSAFNGVPEPNIKDSYIPFSNAQMIQKCVEIYVEEACDNFSARRPFLNCMLNARPGVSEKDIADDIRDFFHDNPREVYPLNRAIKISAEHISENLLEQSPETVWKTRCILFLLFLMVQLIPFGSIGYYAYKDLKIGNHTYSYQQYSSNF